MRMGIFRCSGCGALNRVPPPTTPPRAPRCGKCHKALDLHGKPQDVDDAALEATLKASPVPVLVDLWAPWCGPCRAAGPVVEALGRARAGQMLVLKVNVDHHPAVSGR